MLCPMTHAPGNAQTLCTATNEFWTPCSWRFCVWPSQLQQGPHLGSHPSRLVQRACCLASAHMQRYKTKWHQPLHEYAWVHCWCKDLLNAQLQPLKKQALAWACAFLQTWNALLPWSAASPPRRDSSLWTSRADCKSSNFPESDWQLWGHFLHCAACQHNHILKLRWCWNKCLGHASQSTLQIARSTKLVSAKFLLIWQRIHLWLLDQYLNSRPGRRQCSSKLCQCQSRPDLTK